MMNPPAAIHGAMGRERKPFTYTPGGLDLSQIKSEKMAKRLMRNAMNEGVPERPTQIQSPTTPTTPIPVPNFNCLPVQVFPTFQLPANPKSLLRTRSTPNQYRDPVLEPNQQQSFVNNKPPYPESELNSKLTSNNKTESRPAPAFSKIPECKENDSSRKSIDAVRHVSFNPYELPISTIHEKDYYPTNNNSENFINNVYTRNNASEYRPASMYSSMPSYDSETSNKTEAVRPVEFTKPYDLFTSSDLQNKDLNRQSLPYNFIHNDETTIVPTETTNQPTNLPVNGSNELKPILPSELIKIRAKSQERNSSNTSPNNINITTKSSHENNNDNSTEILEYEDRINDSIAELKSIDINNGIPTISEIKTNRNNENENDQSEVKTSVTTKKQVTTTKQTKTEEINNNSKNGDVEPEAELTVQLPSKKSEAKTETKVEVVKESLPDGGVKEIKTTTTKTTIDGRTEIKTRVETTVIPKETEEEVEEEEEEYEEEEEESGVQVEEIKENGHKTEKTQETSIKESETPVTENGNETIITKEERSETTTTKKVIVSSTENEEAEEQIEEEEEEEVVEEVEENEPAIEEKPDLPSQKPPPKPQESVEVEEEVADEEGEAEEEIVEISTENKTKEVQNEEIEAETVEEKEILQEFKTEATVESTKEEIKEEVEEEEEEEEEYEEAEEEVTQENIETETTVSQKQEEVLEPPRENPQHATTEVTVKETVEEPKHESEQPTEEKPAPEPTPEAKPTTRDIPILFDKVEDIEIKPIGPASEAISRTRTESTEIITSKDHLGGPISTQTELHRVENIVVQNRITKTLDHSYEQLTQQGLPTQKSYFAPTREPVSVSPQPTKPYLPSYTDPTERRHSLLLDRLSVDRQLPPPEPYQIYNESSTYESQNQYQEPQSEVLTVSNVKPSMITNQQWYQQTKKENVIYNNVTPTTPTPASQWSQPAQPLYQPQPPAPPQPSYQAPIQPQPQYQAPPQPYQTPPQPQYRAPSEPRAPIPQYRAPSETRAPVPQYRAPSETRTPVPQYRAPSETRTPVPQYQPPQIPQYQAPLYQPTQPSPAPQSYTDTYNTSNYTKSTNTFQQNSYTPTPSTWGTSSLNNDLSSLNANQYSTSFSNKESTDTYKQNNQYSSSYVPPPWEQDSAYVAPETSQTYYQPPPQTTPTQNTTPSWNPAQPQNKFSKPPPTAYVPPAPNQSFVKPVKKSDAGPRVSGRKTYYSEYERRYISVPESTYVPGEAKYQPQPDPSPQYYYDNDEATEKEEHAWRKELREFSEKSSQTQYSTEQSVRPPWEEEKVYSKTPTTPAAYTPTPTWSQTLRPRSGRERTFESDYQTGSQDWPKTNTIGRGRPLSTYSQSNATRRVERVRGVSVDRYNPNSYKSPIPTEHPPVQSHTLTPTSAPPPKFHANPSVPGYHSSRASAEPRELPASGQNSRSWGVDSRDSPIQSRSFKYLQWITGTDE